MTRAKRVAHCPQCGVAARGTFCADCGAKLGQDHAPHGRDAGLHPSGPRMRRFLTGATLAFALIGMFVAGRTTATRRSDVGGFTGDVSSAPDVSNLTAKERASRLYDRVMYYGETAHLDSAQFFAPMAVQAYAMLGEADSHSRYDVGMIHITIGDTLAARAAADTILRQRPTHLLGLALAMRSAPDRAARNRYAKRLLDANAAEAAAALPEYAEHRGDVDGALTKARASIK